MDLIITQKDLDKVEIDGGVQRERIIALKIIFIIDKLLVNETARKNFFIHMKFDERINYIIDLIFKKEGSITIGQLAKRLSGINNVIENNVIENNKRKSGNMNNIRNIYSNLYEKTEENIRNYKYISELEKKIEESIGDANIDEKAGYCERYINIVENIRKCEKKIQEIEKEIIDFGLSVVNEKKILNKFTYDEFRKYMKDNRLVMHLLCLIDESQEK